MSMNELKRILMAEDDPRDVELTLTALEENKIANEVVVVRDGAEALAYLRREGEYRLRPEGNPALVLLDLKMPKVDGMQVLKEIRSNPALKMIPVVILTSSREERDLVQGYSLGVNAYVVKPVDFGEFASAVKEIGLFWAVINEPPPGSVREKK
jgi:CheY-like chemotaxis protein